MTKACLENMLLLTTYDKNCSQAIIISRTLYNIKYENYYGWYYVYNNGCLQSFLSAKKV